MAQSREIEKLQRRWQENPLGLTFAPLAEAYRKEGMYADALELLEIGLTQHPHYVPAHIVRGRCHLDTGEDLAAEAAFRRVAELDPENVIALKGLADIAERSGRFEDARGQLLRLLAFDRNNEEARFQLERVEKMLITPSPGTIKLGAPDIAPGRPESPEPAVSRATIPQPEAPVTVDLSIEAAAEVGPEPAPSVDTAPVELAAPTLESATPLPNVQPPDWTGAQFEPEVETTDPAIPEAEPGSLPVAGVDVTDSGDVAGGVEGAERPAEQVLGLSPAAVLHEDVSVVVEYFEPVEFDAGGGEVTIGGGLPLGDAGEGSAATPRSPEGGVEEAVTSTPVAAGPAEPPGVAPDVETGVGSGLEPEATAAFGVAEEDEPGLTEEPELVVTETMAEIFLRQGHKELALAVYTQLAQREEPSERVRALIEQLAAELRPQPAPLPACAAAVTGGRSVRALFDDLLAALPPEPAATTAAADRTATGPGGEEPPLEGGPSYDEFFGDDAVSGSGPMPEPGAPAAAPHGGEDIEEFNAWLRGLKR